MGQAIGFAVVIIVLAIVVPEVIEAASDFMLVVLSKAAQLVAALQPPQ